MNEQSPFDNLNNSFNYKYAAKDERSKKDDDLIIEENTVYEIDRECYERLKRQKKRKVPINRNI